LIGIPLHPRMLHCTVRVIMVDPIFSACQHAKNIVSINAEVET
jgi:hypothetical protein